MIEICNILNITPNDLLLENREFDDYKKEIFESLDSNILDMTQTMQIVEEERANALLAKQQGNEKEERQYLDHIIGMFAWTNKHYWEIADFLYYKRIQKNITSASKNTLEKLVQSKKGSQE
ncbi:hypothetical protein [Listeria fleischmannii]|uniref:Uncharacterized protein n=1 Tax=Listeria fleischmannii FSL S10-1203 TaxID=1265822 RepID=W7D8K1_9LIST|nr:hypothetical protein [Listeria fleischmannii]EUJ48964.1 hypothetical protein MCOL2_16357 [Listeria fleischmannii FSL S10-1203]